MTAPVRPVDVPSALGNALERIRILEAVQQTVSGGDYQFLDEEISVAGDYEFALTGIPSTMPDGSGSYRHLVIEIRVAGLIGSENPSFPANMFVSIDHEYTYAPQQVYSDPVDPATPYGTLAQDNESYVTLTNVLSFWDWTGGNGPGYESHLNLHFPYSKALVDDGVLSGMGGWFQAVSFGPLGGTGGGDYGASHVVGGLITDPGGGNISNVRLRGGIRSSFVGPFTGAWSSVTTYNAGDAVSYLGGFYISTDTNLNEAPVAPFGGAHWDTFYTTFHEGSKISAYGIR